VNAQAKTCILKLLFALSTFLLVFPTCLITSADTVFDWLWGSGWTPKFHLRAYGSYVTFSDPLYFDSLGFDSIENNAKIYFENPYMDGVEVEGWWWIQVTKGNMTITDFYADNKFTFTITGSTGDSYTVSFPIAGFGKPSSVKKNGEEISEGHGWSMDAEANIALTGTFASTDTWELSWSEAPSESAGGSGSAGGTGTSGAGGYVPIVPIVRPEVDLRTWGVVAVAGVIGFAVFMSQYKESRRTWKTKKVKGGRWKSKKTEKIKWKKKKKVFD